MSLPHLLLVDDSEAVLAFEAAVLAGRYHLSTAKDGRQGLAMARQLRPDALLLDLSMPEMGGAEMLAALRGEAALAQLPVMIVSSEQHREKELLAAGAQRFLAKPLRADLLLAQVEQLLSEAAKLAGRGSLSALFLLVGGVELGVPLLAIERVLMQPATAPLPGAPAYLSQVFVYQDEPLAVLDLALRLGLPHGVPLVERKLVIFDRRLVPFALQVDQVEDPEDFEAGQIFRPEQIGLPGEGGLRELLTAVVQTPRGTRPILDPRALLSRRALHDLPALAQRVAGALVAR